MGRCRVKKNIRKNDREEKEREREILIRFFFLPSVESDYTKGAGIPARTKGVFDYL